MIKAKVKNIEQNDGVHIVRFDFYGQTLTMMSLELGEDVGVGIKVELNVKPSHVAICKDTLRSSHSNVLKAKITSLEIGKLLAYLVLDLSHEAKLEAIITKQSALNLDLKEGEEVKALIKASELSIKRVIV